MRNLAKTLVALSLAATALVPISATAQDKPSVETLMRRDSVLPPILTWLQSQGSKLTLIGEESGLKGYLVESPTGKMQSVYVTPDGKHIVAGILFEQGGKNVTGVQIGEMRKRFDDAAKALGANAENASVVSEGEKTDQKAKAQAATETDAAPTPDAAPAESGTQATTEEVTPTAAPVPGQEAPVRKSQADTPSVPATATAAAAPTVTIPEATGEVAGAVGNPSDVWASKIDRDEFLKKAEAAPYFEVGSRVAPTTLWMVADPKCPYCHAAWDHVQRMVFDKKIKVRVVLINALVGSEPFAREILASPDPARRWIVSNGGVNIEPTVDPKSKEYVDSEKYLAMNMEFARSFGIDRTPFLGYVAPDGRFYSVLGLPSDLDSFLAASGATSK